MFWPNKAGQRTEPLACRFMEDSSRFVLLALRSDDELVFEGDLAAHSDGFRIEDGRRIHAYAPALVRCCSSNNAGGCIALEAIVDVDDLTKVAPGRIGQERSTLPSRINSSPEDRFPCLLIVLEVVVEAA